MNVYSRKLNETINHIHERALRIVYKDFKSPFQELLIEDNFWTFITEICKNLWLKSPKLKMAYHQSSSMMFSSLSKNHTRETLQTTSHSRSRKVRTAEKHLLNLALNYGTLFQMNVKLFNRMQILRQKPWAPGTVLAGDTRHIFTKQVLFKGTLMQIWKSPYMF